jgi:thiamine biosynthesis protein ThiS
MLASPPGRYGAGSRGIEERQMRLIINGQEKETPALATVADLARWLDLPSFGSAVEVDGQVVRKVEYEQTPLREGVHLEVVRLVGGG